jgi:hypothetical protein
MDGSFVPLASGDASLSLSIISLVADTDLYIRSAVRAATGIQSIYSPLEVVSTDHAHSIAQAPLPSVQSISGNNHCLTDLHLRSVHVLDRESKTNLHIIHIYMYIV